MPKIKRNAPAAKPPPPPPPPPAAPARNVAAPARAWGSPPSGGASTFASSNAPGAAGAEANIAKIRSLLAGHTDRSEEKQIIDIFKKAPPAELNQMFARLSTHDLHELISDVDDRLIGPDNRTALLNTLAKDRLGDLNVDSRAKLVKTLQYHVTDGRDEKAIRDVFLGTRGAQLSELKNQIDSAVDHRDLFELVFHDIDDGGIRKQLLDHFKAEAKPAGQVKILSDIDDTFYANLKDDRFPGKTVYPGVRAFYDALDAGPGGNDRKGDLTFVSARPYDRAGVSDKITRDMLEGNGVKANIVKGDFLHIVGNEQIADKKFENWKKIRDLYPEYGNVLVGDSGQGDAILGARAVAAAPEQIKGMFIHNVTGLDAAQRKDLAGKGVFVFDTYLGAAVESFKRGLISAEGLQKVATAAQTELDGIKFKTPEQKAARQAELDRDVAAMKAALG